MNNLIKALKTFWSEIDPIFELAIYLGIAYAIVKLFGVTYIQAISIVFIYFIMNLLRIVVETIREKYQ